MSIEIYPEDFSTRYELNHAISILMNICYNDIGKIIIVAPANDYNINALKIGSMVYDTVRDATFIIVNVQIDTTTNRITANGYTSNWLLNRRCVVDNYLIYSIEQDVYQVVDDNLRGLPRIDIDYPKGLLADTEAVTERGQLLDIILPILDSAEFGHRMVWNPNTLRFTFEIYKGQDLTHGIHSVVFSEEQGTATNLKVTYDTSTFKNFFFIQGTTQDGESIIETLGDADDSERYEYFVNGSLIQDAEESYDDFLLRMRTACAVEAERRLRRSNFTVDIDPAEFGKIYNLGDMVACVSKRLDVEFIARITGVRYKLDNRASTTELILGDPVLTALGEMRLNYG